MASLVLSGDTSGTVTLAAPAVAGTQSYTLPTAVPAANGYALTSTTGGTMSWAAQTVPGGSTTQVQYNNAGAFGGISGFTTDGTRVTASTTIGVGGATPSTSGSGITFPATQSASTDVNTLDDYEEGTWTPTQGAGLTVIGTFSSAGKYTKIGRVVFVSGTISSTTSITLAANQQAIGSLPFNSNSNEGGGSITSGTNTGLLFTIVGGLTVLYASASNGPSSTFYFSQTYLTAT